jgi:hypothetical protein
LCHQHQQQVGCSTHPSWCRLHEARCQSHPEQPALLPPAPQR